MMRDIFNQSINHSMNARAMSSQRLFAASNCLLSAWAILAESLFFAPADVILLSFNPAAAIEWPRPELPLLKLATAEIVAISTRPRPANVCFGHRCHIYECRDSLVFCVMPRRQRDSSASAVRRSYTVLTADATFAYKKQELLTWWEGGVCP